MSAAPLASSPATGLAFPPPCPPSPPSIAPSPLRRNGVGIAAAVLLHLALLAAITIATVDSRPAISPPAAPPMVAMLLAAEAPAAPPSAIEAPRRTQKSVARPTPPTPPARSAQRLPPTTTPSTTPATDTSAAAIASAPSPAPASAALPAASPSPAASAPVAVVAPRFDAAYLANPAPPYPTASRRMGEEGRVLLRVRVDADGKPTDVSIVRSSGFPRLDDVARDTVLRSWRFVPARQGDQPVAGSVKVPIDFTLTSAP